MTTSLHIPSAFPSDFPAGKSQLDAVSKFYASATISDLSDIQASALLDYREYAEGIIDRLAPALYRETYRAAAERVAIFISRDRDIAEAVVAMMRRRFREAADPDEIAAAVSELEFYDDIEAFVEDLQDVDQP